MGKQYTHEEARAILAEAGIKYTRKEYMAGEVSHRDSEPRRDYTNVGKAAGYTGTEEADAKINAAIERLKWLDVENNREVAAMPGMAIKEAIKQLKIPKVSHYAISHELAPYGLVGIRGHYVNGDVQVYLVDSGGCVTPVCMDFTPNESQVCAA